MFVLLFACAGLVWNVGRFTQAQMKAQSTADAVNLSVMRLRSASLVKIAERWEEFGRLFGPVLADGSVEVSAASLPEIQMKSQELVKAIPGYKGRLTSILKVAMEANRLTKDQHVIEDDEGAMLGITAMTMTVSHESGLKSLLAAGWYRRDWKWEEVSGHRVEWQANLIRFPLIPSSLEAWKATATSQARLQWTMKPDDPDFLRGNGGFPQQWSEAVEGNRLNPHRWPHYRGVLSP